MKLTRNNANIHSLALQHGILTQSTMLLEGREGVLETEKKIYLMMAFVNALVEEDLLELCNEDERNLYVIIMEDIEPFFLDLGEEVIAVYHDLSRILLAHCDKVWDNQHSFIGVMDAILTTLDTMSEEDKKDALIKTGELAEMAYQKRTEALEAKADDVNDKLERFVKQYQNNQNIENNAE